uniref:EF-hand domain-containing protein n=1 Tax=Chelydra serpentina TaxID=8475 RepID=A0A8C3SYU0_CHESE
MSEIHIPSHPHQDGFSAVVKCRFQRDCFNSRHNRVQVKTEQSGKFQLKCKLDENRKAFSLIFLLFYELLSMKICKLASLPSLSTGPRFHCSKLHYLEKCRADYTVLILPGLDIKAFRKAMKMIMDNITEEDIDIIFMKIDTDCDGSVGWEEYLNYILREYRGKEDMLKSKSPLLFQTPMKIIPV